MQEHVYACMCVCLAFMCVCLCLGGMRVVHAHGL